MTHTPGPWEFDGQQVRARDHKGSFPVCDIRGWGHLTGKGQGALGLSNEAAAAIQDANARLIAAAPELLEALRQAVAYANIVAQSEGMPAGEHASRLTAKAMGVDEGGGLYAKAVAEFDVKAARAAIEKATSREAPGSHSEPAIKDSVP